MSRPRRTWLAKLLRLGAFGLVVLVTILALAASWISFNGRAHWAKVKAGLLARGEKLSIIELAPSQIPVGENFFADPLWVEVMAPPNGPIPQSERRLNILSLSRLPGELEQRIRDATHNSPIRVSTGEVMTAARELVVAARKTSNPAQQKEFAALALEAMQPLAELLHAQSLLLQRTRGQAFLDYSLGVHAPVHHISPMLNLGMAYTTRAHAEVILGNHSSAAVDILSAIQLSTMLESEPILISQLVRVSILASASLTVCQGIVRHVWTDEELQAFEQALSGINPMAQLPNALRGERGSINLALEQLEAGGERRDNLFSIMAGLTNQIETSYPSPLPVPLQHVYLALFRAGDQAAFNESLQRLIDATSGKTLDVAKLPRDETVLADEPFSEVRYYFTQLSQPAERSAIGRFAQITDRLRLTRIACALERYRLRHGNYPGDLKKIVPDFLQAIPDDVIANQSFHYKRAGSNFQLWSNGWNLTDENGIENRKYNEGDWSWNQLQ
jgi:hypothetical protein